MECYTRKKNEKLKKEFLNKKPGNYKLHMIFAALILKMMQKSLQHLCINLRIMNFYFMKINEIIKYISRQDKNHSKNTNVFECHALSLCGNTTEK